MSPVEDATVTHPGDCEVSSSGFTYLVVGVGDVLIQSAAGSVGSESVGGAFALYGVREFVKPGHVLRMLVSDVVGVLVLLERRERGLLAHEVDANGVAFGVVRLGGG